MSLVQFAHEYPVAVYAPIVAIVAAVFTMWTYSAFIIVRPRSLMPIAVLILLGLFVPQEMRIPVGLAALGGLILGILSGIVAAQIFPRDREAFIKEPIQPTFDPKR